MNDDIQRFRPAFPALQCDRIYLDSAATALKPQVMIDAVTAYYRDNSSTVLRSHDRYAEASTAAMQKARSQVARCLNSPSDQQILWTSGATAAVNLVAYSFGLNQLTAESEIIVSALEHHSNLIPWLHLAKMTGATVVEWPLEADGTLSIDRFASLISDRTCLVAVTQMSNVTGYQPDLQQVAALTHQAGAAILVDGAQGCVQAWPDVQALDLDFYLFSAHKYYGPTGLGVLYAQSKWLSQMAIWQGGGKMIDQVDFNGFTAAESPAKFEAGTPNIAAILGFSATLQWMTTFDQAQLNRYVHSLVQYAREELQRRFADQFRIISVADSHFLTFVHRSLHSQDVAMVLAEQNIAVRDGKLCAHPALAAYHCDSVIRASFMPYNCREEVNALLDGLAVALTLLQEDIE